MKTGLRHDPIGRRFSVEVEGELAVIDYEIHDGLMTITHTGVPPAIGNHGIAAELTRAALAQARASGWRVRPRCSYAAAFMRRHPEYADLLAD